MNLYPKIPYGGPCPNCGKPKGMLLGKSDYQHDYFVCSDECGYQLAIRLENTFQFRVSDLKKQLDTLLETIQNEFLKVLIINPIKEEARQIELHTCPRRKDSGPWEDVENEDKWEWLNDERVCSFCGSIHPNDFEKIIDRCFIDETIRIEQSTKGYKFYIHRKDIPNASYGAIKFYTWHIRDDESTTKMEGKLHNALVISSGRFEKMIKNLYREDTNE